jgi:hypothetical protein
VPRPASRARTTAVETRDAPDRATVAVGVGAAPTAAADRRRPGGPGAAGCSRPAPARSTVGLLRMAWLRGRPAKGLLTEPDGVFQVEAAHIRTPGQVQIQLAGAGPPQPQHLRWPRLGGDPLDLDAQDGPVHDRPCFAAAVTGMAPLLGMQPGLSRHGHGAVLVVLTSQGGGRGRPAVRVGAVEPGPMAARPATLG